MIARCTLMLALLTTACDGGAAPTDAGEPSDAAPDAGARMEDGGEPTADGGCVPTPARVCEDGDVFTVDACLSTRERVEVCGERSCEAGRCGCSHYVSPTGSADADGRSPATAWSFAHAAASAEAGHTVCVAAGDYGRLELTLERSGTAAQPIRFVGYRSEPFDLPDSGPSTFARGDTVDAAAMPLLDAGDASGMAVRILGDFVSVANLQITRYRHAVDARGRAAHLRNVVMVALGPQTGPRNGGYGVHVYGDDSVVDGCFVQNASSEGIKVFGAENVVVRHSEIYGSNADVAPGYYFLLAGGTTHSVIEDSVAYRELGLAHGGHGFDIKDLGTYNTIRRCTAVHTSFELNFAGVQHNVIEDSLLAGAGPDSSQWHARVLIANGANHNTLRNVRIENVHMGVAFWDNDDGYVGPDGDRDELSLGYDNVFINLVFHGALNAIRFVGDDRSAPAARNTFYNTTFHDVGHVAVATNPNTETRLINCVVDTASGPAVSGGSAPVELTLDHCNFANVGYAPPEGTAITTLPTGFEDAEAGALRLRADSALLDLGVDTEHAYDHDGAPRAPGAFDLGAYER